MNDTERSRLVHPLFTKRVTAVTGNDIACALRLLGQRTGALATALGVSASLVSEVISGKSVSRRVAQHIADLIGLPIEQLWPGKYDAPRGHKSRGRKQA